MTKKLRRWIKTQKRIVKLLYRTGLLNQVTDDIQGLYWAWFRRTNKNVLKSGSYLPEIHFCEVDYWGEADEYSITHKCIDMLFWESANYDEISDTLTSKFQYKGDKWFISYLKSLPIVRTDARINKTLRCWTF